MMVAYEDKSEGFLVWKIFDTEGRAREVPYELEEMLEGLAEKDILVKSQKIYEEGKVMLIIQERFC